MIYKMSDKNANKIIIVGGGKGGVGKTTVTIALVDALITGGHAVIVVESDDSNPDAYKSLKEIVNCEICNLDTEEGYIKLGGIIESNTSAFIVVNTAARLTSPLIKYGSIITDVVSELHRELIMLWPINRQKDSLELLKSFVDESHGYHAIFALKNTYFGTPEKFSRYDMSKLKDRVTGTLVFPELNDLIADKLNDKRLALSNADAHLSLAERSVLRRYRSAASEALNVVYGQ